MAKDQENQSFQEIQQQEQGDDDSASSSSSTVTDVMEEDASSSSSSSSGPLFQLSDLMSHLPIKRGLSSYYEGKSQSCTSFGSLKGIEDLAKKEKNPYKKRMKACRTQRHWLPRPTIAKKASSRSMAGLAGRNLHLLATCNEPTIPIQKQLPI